jgi:hypothetical protein
MEYAKALHTMTVEMTTGMLVLSALAIIVLTCQAYFGEGKYGKYRDALDAVAITGASVGALILILAIVTGYRQWPVEALMNGTIAKNKIFSGYMALAFWGAFVAVRLAAGKALWDRKGLSAFSLILGMGGFAYIVFTASIGGTLAKKPSGFEEIARQFVETRQTFTLPTAANILLVLLGIAIPLIVYLQSRKQKAS